jgi:hypothetical protein
MAGGLNSLSGTAFAGLRAARQGQGTEVELGKGVSETLSRKVMVSDNESAICSYS